MFRYICRYKIQDKYAKYEKYHKVGTIVIIQVDIEVLHIAYVI